MVRLDRLIRYRVYRGFREEGHAPPVASMAASEGVAIRDVRAALDRLAAAHELVLGPGDPGVVRMAHPFSGVATDHVARIGSRSWFGNCAWDGLAILALLGDGSVETSEPLSGEPWSIPVRDHTVEADGVVSFPVPARRFWDDIGYT